MRKTIILSLIVLLYGVSLPAQNCQKIKYGPWVTGTGEDSFTVLWVTDTPGKAWVELADGTRHYHEFAGRRIFERLHTVKVTGLEKGTEYSYKLGLAPLADDTNAYDPTFLAEQESDSFTTKTFDYSVQECDFTVMNDVHLNVGKYRNLITQTSPDSLDFIFLNGDIASARNYVLDTLAHYDFDALKGYCESVPVMFARGNHEGRGNNPKLVSEVFPTRTGHLYYTFRQGPAAFLVLDAGETHADRCLEYTGAPLFQKYLEEQIEWAKKAVKEPAFAEAQLKVCLLHVPMVIYGNGSDLTIWLNEHFLPILNEAGIDLMINGDFHEFLFFPTGSCHNNFPIVVNDNNSRVEVKVAGSEYDLKIYTEEGKVSFSHSNKNQ